MVFGCVHIDALERPNSMYLDYAARPIVREVSHLPSYANERSRS
jgi:hypothetical protein